MFEALDLPPLLEMVMCLPVLWAGAGGWGLLAAADCDGIVSQLEDGDWRSER